MFFYSPEFAAMEPREKDFIQRKFAICLNRIIFSNKEKAKVDKLNNRKDHKLISSLRQLEAASGISFPIIQRLSVGDKNPALTTIVAVAEALEMSLAQFFTYFDSITEEEVRTGITKSKKKK